MQPRYFSEIVLCYSCLPPATNSPLFYRYLDHIISCPFFVILTNLFFGNKAQINWLILSPLTLWIVDFLGKLIQFLYRITPRQFYYYFCLLFHLIITCSLRLALKIFFKVIVVNGTFISENLYLYFLLTFLYPSVGGGSDFKQTLLNLFY